MKHILVGSRRALQVIALMLLAAIATTRIVVAQEPLPFDVKAASGADGQAGEYPLAYTINYDNNTTQDVVLGGDGTVNYVAPVGAINPISIIWNGQFFPLGIANQKICFPRNPNGGCWCLCLQWVRVWPGWWIRRWFWYYDPCC